MRDLLPKNEALKRAVAWISDNLILNPGLHRGKLIDDAVFKFDLNPMEAKYLYNFYSDPDKAKE